MGAEKIEHRPSPERVDNKEVRRGRAAALHGDLPYAALQAAERACKRQGFSAELRARIVCGIFARARNRHLDDHRGNGRQNRHGEHDKNIAPVIFIPWSAPEHRAPLNHIRDKRYGTGNGRRDRADEYIPVPDMRKFMRHDTFKFLLA